MTDRTQGGTLVINMLRAAAERYPKKPMVQFVSGGTHTAEDMLRDVETVAASLQARGVAAGDRIAILLPNRVEFLLSWLASHAIGAIAVPINTGLRGESLVHIIRSTSPVLAICQADLADSVQDVLSDLGQTSQIVVVGEGSVSRSTQASFAELMRGSDSITDPVVAERDPCCIMFTSGTTGPSKGVTWSNKMSDRVASVASKSMGYGPDDVLYICLPLFHGNALATSFLPALRSGATVVVAERFSASRFWSDLVEYGATVTNILGVMGPILLRQEPSKLEKAHNLRTALVIPAPEAYYAEMRNRFGLSIVEAYGQVDVGMPLWNSIDDPRPGSCGLPTEGFECRLVDSDDIEVEEGQVGELVLRWNEPYMSLLGYWGLPAATVEATRNLWFHTGDLMRRDSDGWYYFVDRVKDVIRRRGENISSFEVEVALLDHPNVVEAAAYPVPSELSEDEVAVAVVVTPGVSLTAFELMQFLEPKLPYFAVPRYIEFVDNLPKTQTEKIQKGMLKSRGVTPRMWDRDAAGYVVKR